LLAVIIGGPAETDHKRYADSVSSNEA
jgi:hypothetical protein